MGPTFLTRRKFLQTTAAASLGAAIAHVMPKRLSGQGAVAGGSEVVPGAAPGWARKPMRWMQLTLVEDDPRRFDAGFWLDYFKRTRSDGVCLSGGRVRRLLSD